MMDNPQAFPVADQGVHGSYGMSLRDYFAGQALAGMNVMSLEGWSNKEIAQQAFSLADAMLAARATQDRT